MLSDIIYHLNQEDVPVNELKTRFSFQFVFHILFHEKLNNKLKQLENYG